MRTRVTFATAIILMLSACADPPGAPRPLPTDYAEQNKMTDIFRRYSKNMEKVDGVYTTYLTANNNPRRMIVVVRDKKVRKELQSQFGREVEGLSVRYEIAEKNQDNFGGIEQVPTQELPTTWWGKAMAVLTEWHHRWMGTPETDKAPKPRVEDTEV